MSELVRVCTCEMAERVTAIEDWIKAEEERQHPLQEVKHPHPLEADDFLQKIADAMPELPRTVECTINRLCAKCHRSCKSYGKNADLLKCSGYVPTIEQEIEAGLVDGNNGHWYVLKGNRAEGCGVKKDACTRILLPMDKYQEYTRWQIRAYESPGPMKRTISADIPVTYCGLDKIEYLT